MLPFARTVIRLANGLNWIVGVGITLMVAAMLIAPSAIRARLDASEALVAENYYLVVLALALVIPVVPLVHAIFIRLLALIDTADTDRCFSEANAARLVVIAWCLVGINLVDLAFGAVDYAIDPAGSGWVPTLTGWFAALLLFVLAGVFRRGAQMRADLEGTV